MKMSDTLIKHCTNRIVSARTNILFKHGFFGLLLMHTGLKLSDEKDTAWIEDGDTLVYNPEFIGKLNDKELQYTLMHLILHIILKHSERGQKTENPGYYKAADIVINSNILQFNNNNQQSIYLSEYGGIQQHHAPNGEEGWRYTVEKVMDMLEKEPSNLRWERWDFIEENRDSSQSGWDIHEVGDADESVSEKWKNYIYKACEIIKKSDKYDSKVLGLNYGLIPGFILKKINEIQKSKLDWRTILNNFIEEDFVDYSLLPPDRRFSDNDFFLPDFNVKDEKPEKILFMIDTSGSMNQESIQRVYSEVYGAVEQFSGKLEGWLGFFDAAVVEPKPFESISDLKKITPSGGGGTSFDVIFDYVRDSMKDDPPNSIIILTDGWDNFPDESAAMGIPVLWILTENTDVPWGKKIYLNERV